MVVRATVWAFIYVIEHTETKVQLINVNNKLKNIRLIFGLKKGALIPWRKYLVLKRYRFG